MVCIYCGSKTQVTNSRPQKRLNRTWRRRECLRCHAIFTTEEAVNLGGSIVVQRLNKAVEPFSRDKLFASLLKSLGHRERAVEEAGALCATTIVRLLQGEARASLTPQEIAHAVRYVLRHFDSAAAVQYQAYHPSSFTTS